MKSALLSGKRYGVSLARVMGRATRSASLALATGGLSAGLLLSRGVPMAELTTAVCSIVPTQRRRYFWAAWWTHTPRYAPFQKPDASHGGARSRDEALAQAQRMSGRHLTVIEDHWASAWKRVLRGEASPAPPADRPQRVAKAPAPVSAWALLGLTPGATLAELKRAYRQRALETHPDQGGESEQFQRVQRAYEKLAAQLAKKR